MKVSLRGAVLYGFLIESGMTIKRTGQGQESGSPALAVNFEYMGWWVDEYKGYLFRLVNLCPDSWNFRSGKSFRRDFSFLRRFSSVLAGPPASSTSAFRPCEVRIIRLPAILTGSSILFRTLFFLFHNMFPLSLTNPVISAWLIIYINISWFRRISCTLFPEIPVKKLDLLRERLNFISA